MYTGYFGMQSPVCRPLEGLRLPTVITEHVYCDPWGVELSAARLPVETYTPCHDALRDMMEVVLRESHLVVHPEPAHIFASLIHPQRLLQPGAVPAIIWLGRAFHFEA